MNSGSGVTRWWESYLVRYLMPSIAGVVIVLWLGQVGGVAFRKLLLLPEAGVDLTGPRLLLLLLYGNLFCYVASYPILTFHATRVIDLSLEKWPNQPWRDGYLWTAGLGILVLVISVTAGTAYSYAAAFVTASAYSAFQIWRLLWGITVRRKVQGLGEMASPIFGYAYALARRRSVVEETETTDATVARSAATRKAPQKIKTTRWHQEFMETYRHLREHGNSAYIFFLELSLAALVYAILAKPENDELVKISSVAVLLAVWAAPAIIVHLAGQHLERRFSLYDRRTKS